jgi:hypothetical protein
MDIAIIALVLTLAAIILSVVLNIYCTFKIIQISSTQLAGQVNELNEAVGEAVSMVVDLAPSEPINPLHGIIARIMEAQLEPKSSVKVLQPKDDKGQFTSDKL